MASWIASSLMTVPCKRFAKLCFIVVLCAGAESAPLQDDAFASHAAQSSSSMPRDGHGVDGEKWSQLEKIVNDGMEQAAATEAWASNLASMLDQQEIKQKQETEALELAQQAEQTQMISGMKQAVAVLRFKAGQESLEGGRAAKVRLGCAFGCSGHGTCDRMERRCACSNGWIGELCDQPRCANDCSGNGLCVSGNCRCHEGWLGSSCSQARCPGDCSGNGYCFGGECMCDASWTGKSCSTLERTHGDLRSALRLSRRNVMPSASSNEQLSALSSTAKAMTCPGDCSGHGTCAETGNCNCHAGYSGITCDAKVETPKEVPEESDFEDALFENDGSEQNLSWQARAKATQQTSFHTVAKPRVANNNSTSFQGTPLTAEWIAQRAE